MNQLLFTKGPQAPIGATLGTAMNNFYSSPNKVSTILLLDLEKKMFEICMVLALCNGGHTYDLNNFESPTPKDDTCQVWLKSNHAFSRRWKCKKFTDDGRKRTAIAHSSLWLRWAKKSSGFAQLLLDFFPPWKCHFLTTPFLKNIVFGPRVSSPWNY